MREQMPDRRALGPGRLVEVDHTLLRGNQRGERRDELRHGCPAHGLAPRPMGRDDVAVPDDTRSRERRGPALDLPKCLLHRRAILNAWLADSCPPARPTRRRLASRARPATVVTSSLPAPAQGWRTVAILPATGTARPGAASRSSWPRSPRRVPRRS